MLEGNPAFAFLRLRKLLKTLSWRPRCRRAPQNCLISVAVANAGLVVYMAALAVSPTTMRPHAARRTGQNGRENDGDPFQERSPWSVG